MLSEDWRIGDRETGALYRPVLGLSKMNSLSSSRREVVAKNLATRATSLPAELNRYSRNCKLLCNILRDTKIIINEINTADYLTQGLEITFNRLF